ncbi:sterol desaturase family protein [Marivirga harenae]|uniref:sterol desaturase family protein n=1 Tax=Marivirga harenae TaxID=2010992 RepID=UPI0026DFBE2A|nr:sterol desaturase family protein [Marivirga harenae]WKV11544.1 sterol desaturase family protein [Marivirga harenae]|tara:strand:+ start:29508 stop:30752 length:1245 start_codon:yes stop_codon:yes gene_type:complete
MDFNPIILSIPIYFALIGIELLIQAVKRYRIYRLNDAITNISCGITQQVTGIFFKVLSVAAYQWVFENFALFSIAPTWYNLILLFILADFFYYWAHRKSHEINLFWGGHVVHHQSEDYNFSVALRQGSFQIIWTFFFYFPLAILGFDTLSFVLMSGLVTVYQFWIHTETIRKMGVFELIFNTPSHHRVHHGRNPKYIDKNHAGVFIIWDKMFGTFQKEEEKPTYGITKQTASWNPVWVNLQHYVEMSKGIRQMKGIKNKLKYIFYKPGWRPKEMGGQMPIPAVDPEHDQKFDKQASGAFSLYVLVQYIIILGGTALFLFTADNFNTWEQILAVALIILGVTSLGVVLEEKKYSFALEIFRVLLTPIVIVFVLLPVIGKAIMIAILAYGLLSFASLIFIKKSYSTVEQPTSKTIL